MTQNDSCIKMGSDASDFYVSLNREGQSHEIMSHRPQPLKRKASRPEAESSQGLSAHQPYRQAKLTGLQQNIVSTSTLLILTLPVQLARVDGRFATRRHSAAHSHRPKLSERLGRGGGGGRRRREKQHFLRAVEVLFSNRQENDACLQELAIVKYCARNIR